MTIVFQNMETVSLSETKLVMTTTRIQPMDAHQLVKRSKVSFVQDSPLFVVKDVVTESEQQLKFVMIITQTQMMAVLIVKSIMDSIVQEQNQMSVTLLAEMANERLWKTVMTETLLIRMDVHRHALLKQIMFVI